MRLRPFLALCCALIVGALTAACSGDYNRYATNATPTTTAPSTTSPPATPPPTTIAPDQTTLPPTTDPGATTTTVAPPPGVPPGRLAVVTEDGGLVTVRPDGAEVRTVADPPAGGTVVQVAWSPDGSRLAYSTTARREAAIGVASADAASTVSQPLPTAPYHLAWSPTQADLAYLRVDTVDTVELAVRDSAMTAAARRVASNAPMYGVWSPDGQRLLAKVGNSQLMLSHPSGAATGLGVEVAPSGAPAWIDNDTVVTAVQTSADRRLVLLDVNTGDRQDLLTYEGVITFVVDPTSGRIAYQLTPEEGSSGGGGRVSFPRQPGGSTSSRRAQSEPPPALDGVVAVHDITTGIGTQVLDHIATAFQWSPDGSRLALLDPSDDGSSRWRFWSANGLIDGTAFVPSQTSAQLLFPYFDQLATSTRWWSPDGTAFTFAGRVQGRDGVWVQPVAASTPPTFVHEGGLTVWSWQ